MRFLDRTTVNGVHPEMLIAMFIANEVYNELMGQGVTIYSVTDGVHKSYVHPHGYAIDLRTRHDTGTEQWAKSTKEALAEEMRRRLTKEYDVVVEDTHIHLEFDRR
jgi:hypothetical protein